MPNLPGFLCVGAQKSGTTWLYSVLSENPHVFLPRVKELLHFVHVPEGNSDDWRHRVLLEGTLNACNEYIHEEREAVNPGFLQYILSFGAADRFTDGWYKRIYSTAPQNVMSGDITPSYMVIGSIGIERIRALLGDVKIILLLRDPIDRLWSQVRMISKQSNLDPEKDFSSIVNRAECQSISNYALHVPPWIQGIAPENLGIFNYHALGRSGDAFYTEVLNFLGLPPHTAPSANSVVHSGMSYDMPTAIRDALTHKLSAQVDFMHTTFGPNWKDGAPRMHVIN